MLLGFLIASMVKVFAVQTKAYLFSFFLCRTVLYSAVGPFVLYVVLQGHTSGLQAVLMTAGQTAITSQGSKVQYIMALC